MGMDNSVLEPVLELMGKILSKSAKFMWRPYEAICDAFGKLPNAGLYFFGFSMILVPLMIAYWITFLTILLAEILVFLTVVVGIGLVLVLVGIWPSLIIAVDITGIIILWLPFNIYYHCVITYRTVMLRWNMKVLSFILLPIIHILIPPVVFIMCLLFFGPWFAALSFAGYPISPWNKIKPYHKKAWNKIVTEVKIFFRNYGHSSGIPMNWDGSIYGLPVDPFAVILSIILYLLAVIPISICVFTIFTVKALPIFLATLQEFWKVINISKSLKWYRRVLTGAEGQDRPQQNRRNDREQSGHSAWSSKIKQSSKGIVKFIEGYAKINIIKSYGNIVNKYAQRIRIIHPKKLHTILESYGKDFSPCKMFPENPGLAILILWIPLLMTTFMWIIGLILMITIPPATFALIFVVWLVLWPAVLIVPPLLYIGGWLFIIFGLPTLYILLWISILTFPWVFAVLGCISGPFLSLRIPISIISSYYYNPVDMWSNIRRALRKIPKIVRSVDRFTSKYSIGNLRFFKGDDDDIHPRERKEIKYWDLFIARCIKESIKIQKQKWILSEDVMGASATAVLAIPGVSIVSILVDSIKKNKKEKTSIYWNEDNLCKESNRDYTDNIANVFWPKIMKVKEALMTIDKVNLDSQSTWISASLCDGEDEKSDELKIVLEDLSMGEAEHKKCLRIRAMVEDIVHSLLRVNAMTSRMLEIFAAVVDEESAESD